MRGGRWVRKGGRRERMAVGGCVTAAGWYTAGQMSRAPGERWHASTFRWGPCLVTLASRQRNLSR